MNVTRSKYWHVYPLVLGFTLGLILVFYLLLAYSISQRTIVTDFAKLYSAAENYYTGKYIYSPVVYERHGEAPGLVQTLSNQEYFHPNLNPPFQTLLFLPLVQLEINTAYLVWSLISILFGLLAAVVIFRALQPHLKHKSIQFGIALLLFAYFPAFTTIVLGQISFLVLLLLALAWASSSRNDDILAGIALGLAISLKLYVGLFLLVFLLLRRWKLLAWAVGTITACGLLALAVFGAGAYRDYLVNLRSVTWYAASWNASYLGFFTRIFGGSENVPVVQAPWLAYVFGYGLSLLSIGLLAWQAWRTPFKSSSQRFDMLFSLAIVVMLLASPLGWMYYFVYLIIPFLVIWLDAQNGKKWGWAVCVIAAWVLSTVPHLIIPAADVTPIYIFLWAGVYFYALLIFQAMLMILLRRMASCFEL